MNQTSLLPTLLLVLFIGLKLTGNIDWSWWWVFSPVWVPLSIALILALVYGAFKLMFMAVENTKK